MVTAIEMIADAFRLANIINEIEAPSAEQGVQGLRSLNQMMGQWDRDGIKLGWHVVPELDDPLPLDPQDERAVKFNLAVELSGEYGLEPMPWVSKNAIDTYAALAKAHRFTVESDLSHLPTAQPFATGMTWPMD